MCGVERAQASERAYCRLEPPKRVLGRSAVWGNPSLRSTVSAVGGSGF